MVKSVIIASVGGFIGTALRYTLSRFIQDNLATSFPWATFSINILGSLLIGLIFGFSEKGNFLSSDVRLFLTVGICGGFTTFSSFSNDAFLLVRDKEWYLFSLYASLSFFLCITAVFLGRIISKFI